MMPLKPICVPCRRFFRVQKTGKYFIEGMPTERHAAPGTAQPELWKPYKLWSGDLWKCEGCGAEVIVGTGRDAIAEHYQPDFVEKAVRLNGGHSDQRLLGGQMIAKLTSSDGLEALGEILGLEGMTAEARFPPIPWDDRFSLDDKVSLEVDGKFILVGIVTRVSRWKTDLGLQGVDIRIRVEKTEGLG